MIVLEESPWYQEIIRRGEHRERVRTLLQILEQRFGVVPPLVVAQLTDLDISTLDDLARMAITTASLEEFLQAVAQHTTPEPSDNAE
jgi:hypothetical protein